MTHPQRSFRRSARVAAGPLAFAAVLLLAPAAFSGAARMTLATTAWVAAWWILEALPIPATSLLPLVLLPVLGVRPATEVARLYANDLIFLLLGGFLLALTIERWGLHRRVALFVLGRVGSSPRRLSFGFLLAAAVLSMWISNTATALMLLPIALAVCTRLGEAQDAPTGRRTQVALLLSVAYGANLGGIGTYIGTPPNLIFRERYAIDFGAGQQGGPADISFLQWMLAFAPMTLLFLPVVWFALARTLPGRSSAAIEEVLEAENRSLPTWSSGEIQVGLLFVVTAILWITRVPIRVGEHVILGWTRWFPEGFEITDGTVAIAMALTCFVVRARGRSRDAPGDPREPLMDWSTAESGMPWGILLLYGAGFALGDTFQTSGLSQVLGEQLAGSLAPDRPLLLIGSICLLMTFLTEVTSNTASTSVFLPILSAVALQLQLPAPMLLLPATLAASCAFMLPVGTPPNAIVFATGQVPIRSMVRIGFWINLAAVLWITLYLYHVALPILGIERPG